MAFEVIYPIISYVANGGKKHGDLRKCYSRERFIYSAIFLAVFAVLQLVFKLIFFNGEKSAYQLGSIVSFFEPYRIWYALYAFIYIISGVMIAALILPFVYPLLQYSRLNEASRKLFILNVLSILLTIAVVVYTISLYEDYGTMQPETHVRYVAHFVLIAIILFLRSTQTEYSAGRGHWTAVILAASIPCIIYRGMQASGTEACLLKFYESYKDAAGTLGIDPKIWISDLKNRDRVWVVDSLFPLEIPVYAILFGIVMIVLAVIFHWLFTHGREKNAVKLEALFIAMIMLSSSISARNDLRMRNADRNDYLADITAVNDYFSNINNEFNMLYITGDKFNKSRCAVDTYLNMGKNQHIFTMESKFVDMEGLQENDYIIERITFINTCGAVGSVLEYGTIESLEYILIDNTAGFKGYNLENVTRELDAGIFTLYRNNAPAFLVFREMRACSIQAVLWRYTTVIMQRQIIL